MLALCTLNPLKHDPAHILSESSSQNAALAYNPKRRPQAAIPESTDVYSSSTISVSIISRLQR